MISDNYPQLLFSNLLSNYLNLVHISREPDPVYIFIYLYIYIYINITTVNIYIYIYIYISCKSCSYD